MKRLTPLLILSAALIAADDDPEPTVTTTVNSVTSAEPAGFRVTILIGPIVNINGTNSSDIKTVSIEKLRTIRVMQNGVQVGPSRIDSIGVKDATNWLLNQRTNINGALPIALATGKATWAAVAWNNITNQ